MLENKGLYMQALKKHDFKIKEIDSAIPCAVSRELKELNIDSDFLVTVYYKSGAVKIENCVARVTLIYSEIAREYVNNFLTLEKLGEHYKLDKNEIALISALLD